MNIQKLFKKVTKLVGITLIETYESRLSLAMDHVAELEVDLLDQNSTVQFMDLEKYQSFCKMIDRSMERLPGMRYAVHNENVVLRVTSAATLDELDRLHDLDLIHSIPVEVAVRSAVQIERFLTDIIVDYKLEFPEFRRAIKIMVSYMTNIPVAE